jgi:hypothetical protein
MRINQTKSVVFFILAAILCLLLFEFLLHCYNPNRSRVRNGKILLPTNQSYVFNNTDIPKIGKHIVHTKNSLGFRGPEIPTHFSDYLSIVTVGGSTTECYYLSDNETWPYLVSEYLKRSHGKVWLNNAGLDGFSTFGISTLMDDYISRIRPKYALFLLGANEIGMKAPGKFDAGKIEQAIGSISILELVKNNSEILDFAGILLKKLRSKIKGENLKIGHNPLVLQKLAHRQTDDRTIDSLLDIHRIQFIPSYKERILLVIRICRQNGITPVFITQPIMVGKGVDEMTKVNLETIDIGNGRSGRMEWRLMELYNDTLRECAIDKNVPLIDLAKVYPKDSRYFYDFGHFGVDGARLAAALIGKSLDGIIRMEQ